MIAKKSYNNTQNGVSEKDDEVASCSNAGNGQSGTSMKKQYLDVQNVSLSKRNGGEIPNSSTSSNKGGPSKEKAKEAEQRLDEQNVNSPQGNEEAEAVYCISTILKFCVVCKYST